MKTQSLTNLVWSGGLGWDGGLEWIGMDWEGMGLVTRGVVSATDNK